MGEKNPTTRKICSGRWPGVFPLKGSNRQYKHLKGSCQAGFRGGSLAAYAYMVQVFFFFRVKYFTRIILGKWLGPGGGPQQNPGGLCADEVCEDC